METALVVVAAFIALLLFRRALSGPRLSGAEARAKIAAGAKLVDVRSAGEFAGGHIDGALNIPHTQVSERAAEIGGTGTEVVVYCASGMRSGIAAGALRKKGYTVHNLGPMSAW